MTKEQGATALANTSLRFRHSSFVIRHSCAAGRLPLRPLPRPLADLLRHGDTCLEALGWNLEIQVVSPPLTSFRHGRESRPTAAVPVFYAPHGRVLDRLEARARREGRWPAALVAEHEQRFGTAHSPARRARHALWFADLCRRRGIGHVHVHFASDAVHTALFLASFGGPPFSFTAHGQDFMLDLGNDDLLREMAARARFVVAVERLEPGSAAGKMSRQRGRRSCGFTTGCRPSRATCPARIGTGGKPRERSASCPLAG